MQLFWRTDPASEEELELIGALGAAHNKSSFRPCPSTIAVQCTAQGSGDLFRATAAALICFGGRHGPIEATYELLVNPYATVALAEGYLEREEKVPGWGSSFTDQGEGDPLWKPVHTILFEHFNSKAWILDKVTEYLHQSGIKIYPNPSAYTALSAIILQMPKRLSPYLLIMGRLSAWAEIFSNETKGT